MAGRGQIRKLKRRISSVQDTKQITRAFEMIAASRILKAQRRVQEARPYAEQITEVIRGLASTNAVTDHPLLAPHDAITDVGVVVITSDRGLCGAYNSNVLSLAQDTVAEEEDADGRTAHVYQVGTKGRDFFEYRGRTPAVTWEGMSDRPGYEDASEVASTFMQAYRHHDLDRVWVVYTDFKTSLTQIPTRKCVLPVDPDELEGGEAIPPEFVFEPAPDEILELLIPRYVEAKMFAALLESAASEHASRQRAMKNATENAEEVVENLSREMNAARQEQITTEITEIVGGAEALKQEG